MRERWSRVPDPVWAATAAALLLVTAVSTTLLTGREPAKVTPPIIRHGSFTCGEGMCQMKAWVRNDTAAPVDLDTEWFRVTYGDRYITPNILQGWEVGAGEQKVVDLIYNNPAINPLLLSQAVLHTPAYTANLRALRTDS